jgi:hypothetical protein
MPAVTKKQYQNTTVRVPKHVYEQAKNVVRRSEMSSFNEFVVQAIEEKVRRLTEAEIDAAFAQMAQDEDYQRSSVVMAQEFAKSDWEAFDSAHTGATPFSPVVDLMQTLKKSSDKAHTHGRHSKARTR